MTYQELYTQVYNATVSGFAIPTPTPQVPIPIVQLMKISTNARLGRTGSVEEGRNQVEIFDATLTPIYLQPIGFHPWMYIAE